jgi:hypothetical protein
MKKSFLLVILFINVLIFSVLVAANQGTNSDVVNHFLLSQTLNKGVVFLPPDSFLAEFPYFFLLFSLFHYSLATIVIAELGYVFLLFAGFFYFYFVVMKECVDCHNKLFLLLPLLLLANISTFFYRIVTGPWLRYPLFSIFLLSLLLWRKEYVQKAHAAFLLFLFAILLVMDPYYIVIFVIPLLFSYTIILIRQGFTHAASRRIFVFQLSCLFSVILSVFLQLLIQLSGRIHIGTVMAGIASPGRIFYNSWLLLNGILLLFGILPFSVISLINACLLILSIIGLCLFFWQSLKQKKIIGICIFFMFLSTISAYIFSLNVFDIGSTRYLFPLPFLSIFGLAIIGNRIYTKKRFYSIIFISMILFSSCYTFINYTTKYHMLSFKQRFSDNYTLLAFLDEEKLSYGYTFNYWNASINTYLSAEKIKIRTITCDSNQRIAPFYWLSNSSWYESSTFEGKTFVLIGKPLEQVLSCNKNTIQSQFGKPEKELSFSIHNTSYELLIFPYNIAEKFK